VEGQKIGDFVTVFVEDCTQGTLLGKRFKNYNLEFLNSNFKSQLNYERLTIHKKSFRNYRKFPALNRALEKAIQVAPTDISVLVIGESGVGKNYPENYSFRIKKKTSALYCCKLWCNPGRNH
jgi:transcriptional regulator with GAF, ATPase, and Fis domain